MQKLKLTAPIDDKPVKLTIELPAHVHRDPIAYADVLGRETAQSIEPGNLNRADARRSDGEQWRIPTCAEAVATALADANLPRQRVMIALQSYNDAIVAHLMFLYRRMTSSHHIGAASQEKE